MIGILGISHKTAIQDIREKFIFSKEEIVPFADYVQQNSAILELVILSTCNRTEIYYYQNKAFHSNSHKRLIDLVRSFKNASEVPEGFFYKHIGLEAVKHIFKVTSGMDSIVIGEDQIVGQVKDAYLFCTEATLTNVVLMRLFQKSFEASKRVRSETKIQQGPTSVSYVAVDLCSKIYTDLSDKCVMFIGSGETGNLALYNMKKRGVTKTFISNRTFDKAKTLANEYNGVAVDFQEYNKFMPLCDIVIVATSAKNHLICKEDVESSIATRNSNPQVYIDLSVPRNIDKSISSVEHVQLFDVDYMQEVLDNTVEMRKQSIEQAEIIIEQVALEFMEWFDSLTIRPIIKTITANMQNLCVKEVALYKTMAGNKNSEIIDEYANRLMQKYTGTFIKILKEISKNNTSSNSLNIINELFMFDKNLNINNEQ